MAVKNMTQAKSSLLVVLSEKLAGVLARAPAGFRRSARLKQQFNIYNGITNLRQNQTKFFSPPPIPPTA